MYYHRASIHLTDHRNNHKNVVQKHVYTSIENTFLKFGPMNHCRICILKDICMYFLNQESEFWALGKAKKMAHFVSQYFP